MTTPTKRAWWKGVLRFLLFAVVVALTFLVLVMSWISLQGRREWSTTKKELLARGEKLSLIELAPPPVPDAENFFTDPMWTEMLFEGKSEILSDGKEHTTEYRISPDKLQSAVLEAKPGAEEIALLKERFPAFANVSFDASRTAIANNERINGPKYGDEVKRREYPSFALAVMEQLAPLLTKISKLRQRPGARFPLDYTQGFGASMPHIGVLLYLGPTFAVRAKLEIALHQNEMASQDCLTIIALSRTVMAEPILISQLVRVSMLVTAAEPIREGVAAHVWTDEELAAFERGLQNEDLLAGLALGFRGERGAFNQSMEYLRTHPSLDKMFGFSQGFSSSLLQKVSLVEQKANPLQLALGKMVIRSYLAVFGAEDQAFSNNFIQQEVDEIREAQSAGFIDRSNQRFQKLQESKTHPGFVWSHIFSILTNTAFESCIKQTAFGEDTIVQVRLACALERYYLKHKEYPAALDALAPEYFTSLPVDAVTLKPMHYERTAPDQFRLWAIGWDGKDDNGRSVPHRNNARFEVYAEDGDWVWGE